MHLHTYYNFAGSLVDSYGRRSPGLKFRASVALTLPLNLPALGRSQPVYVVSLLRTDLCF